MVGCHRPAGRRGHARGDRRTPAARQYHDTFATALAREAGVAPDLLARPELTEPLLFGPLLPPRYRLDGPHARPDAAAAFTRQLAASPRPPVDPAAIPALRGFGLPAEADRLSA